jgi:hypothetical protein
VLTVGQPRIQDVGVAALAIGGISKSMKAVELAPSARIVDDKSRLPRLTKTKALRAARGDRPASLASLAPPTLVWVNSEGRGGHSAVAVPTPSSLSGCMGATRIHRVS